jgi:hypothetical protein
MIADTIREAMARAFFACAWADQAEETGNSQILSGADIMDVMPLAIDPAAVHAADTLVKDLIKAMWPKPQHHSAPEDQALGVLFRHARSLPTEGADRALTPELFGHYLAMQAMGSGVGLESFGPAVRDAFRVPYVEFGSHSLERDYFTQVEKT